ncbi:CHC2 zinc finger domain-containing protein [Xanthobacter oligotrophicus]|uniref:CHC2 zinc finger domain-containing protein n=1 Tax=Xanthobacter oligotrophicus TaxID=2607286 RepID=A0ABW6ZPS1_9HYPH
MDAALDAHLAFAEWVAQARAVPVLDVIAKRKIALKKAGTEMVGPCPVCGGNDRFGVSLRKKLWNCRHSGRGGDAIALVQYLDGADFLGACETLTCSPPPKGQGTRLSPEEIAARDARRQADEDARASDDNQYREDERRRLYEAFWLPAARRLAGTPAEAYLALRGISDPHSRGLRFHPSLPYYHGEVEDERGRKRSRMIYRGPAMVAAITDAGGTFRGLHQTWIDLDRPKGKAEIICPDTGEVLVAKKVRGTKQGGHILILPAAAGPMRRIYAAEGIETVLSVWVALMATGADLSFSAFVCAADLGNLAGRASETIPHPTALVTDKAGRQRRQRVPGPVPDLGSAAMPIPSECTELVLLGDGDSEPFLTEMAMVRAQRRHAAPGRDVRVVMAPAGQDFNDLLRAPEQARSAVANGATSNSPTQHREGAAA